MGKKLAAVRALAAIMGVVAVVFKSRDKYTKVRTNYQEESQNEII